MSSDSCGESESKQLNEESISSPIDELVLGELISLDHDGNPVVGYLANGVFFEYPAITTKPIVRSDVHRRVALMFVQGDVQRPIILGFIRSHLEQTLEATLLSETTAAIDSIQVSPEEIHPSNTLKESLQVQDIQLFPEDPFSEKSLSGDTMQITSEINAREPSKSSINDLMVSVDDDKVELTGKNEITLRCGESSLTLTKSGRILLRGKYIVSRASGTNRILGGSVQVN